MNAKPRRAGVIFPGLGELLPPTNETAGRGYGGVNEKIASSTNRDQNLRQRPRQPLPSRVRLTESLRTLNSD